jgi:hypothetical protein
MRRWVLFSAFLVLAASRAFGDSDLVFTLVSYSGTGSPASLAPDPSPPCSEPNCVLFSGTLTDTDVDADPAYPVMVFPAIGVTFSPGPAGGVLSLDNTFYDSVDFFPGTLSGDPNWATDGLGNPPNSYTGPLFGIDIAPGTSLGEYAGIITISAAGGLLDPNYTGFTITQEITVEVAPEPSAAALSLAGLFVLVLWKYMRLPAASPPPPDKRGW